MDPKHYFKGTSTVQNEIIGVIRVSDPHRFNADPDPDPAFLLIADPDSGSGSRIRIPDPDPGFDDLKLKKIYNKKFNFHFFDKKLQFTYP